MTNLYFVRHAHSTFSTDELGRPLSDKGFTDAAKVTNLLKMLGIDVVVSSPYKRAIQTVEGISQYIQRDIEIIDGFKERILTVEPAGDFALAITKVWEDDKFSWPGGESNTVAQERGVESTYDLLEKYKDRNIVIGTHGNIMVLIMNFFDQQYDYTFWQNLSMPDIYQLTFDGKVLTGVERIYS